MLPVRNLLTEDGQIACLIKPQFEAGREKVGKKGVVRDPAVHQEVIEMVTDYAQKHCLSSQRIWSILRSRGRKEILNICCTCRRCQKAVRSKMQHLTSKRPCVWRMNHWTKRKSKKDEAFLRNYQCTEGSRIESCTPHSGLSSGKRHTLYLTGGKENSGGEQGPEYKSSNPDKIPDDVDCVLVLGGDGTVLRAARDLVKRHLPLFGVNLGTLGYLAEVDQDHLETALDHLVLGEYITEEHMMLRGVVCHEGQEILSDVALNDIVIARSGRIHVMDLKIYVNDRFLNEYSADGMIISTPTGSTGYNLSVGGPIVSPAASLILLTPIAPHTLNARSVILPDTAKIKVVIGKRKEPEEEAEVAFDGDTTAEMTCEDYVVVEKAQSTVQFVKVDQISFLETLRKKMSGT